MPSAKIYRATFALILTCYGSSVWADNTEEKENTGEDPTLETLEVLGKRTSFYTVITDETQKLVDMPGALGDPLSAITALPGVITPADGDRPAVRGSSPSDNRYYIDGMPAGYIFHQFSTSIVDENIVQDFQIYSAGFGAQYNNVTGGVFDIHLREPLNQQLQTSLSFSILRASLKFEGGVTENSAFYASVRSGLLHFFISEEDTANDDGIRIQSAPEDSDYVVKYLWQPSDNSSLTVSFIGAEDSVAAEFTEQSSIANENPDFAGNAKLTSQFDNQSITWKQTSANDITFGLSLGHANNGDELFWGDNYFQTFDYDNYLLKGSTDIPIGQNHLVTLGLEYNQYDFIYSTYSVLFICTEFDPSCDDGRQGVVNEYQDISLAEQTAYAIDRWQLTSQLQLEAGLQFNQNDYTNEQFVNPRMALAWELANKLTITSSAGIYNRFPDLDTILPTIGNPNLKSPTACHYTLGLKGDTASIWNWSVETYYKELSDLPLALPQSQVAGDPDGGDLSNDNLSNGNLDNRNLNYSNDISGVATGVDLLINRNFANNWYGWMALSYSQSKRTNELTDTTQDYNIDTPLVLNLVGNYQLTPSWNTGLRLTAKSGQAYNKIIGIKENPNFPDNYLPVYAEPAYDDRLPVYYRLDFRVKKDFTLFSNDAAFFVDILNLTNKQNISSRQLDYKKVNETGELHIEEEAELGRIASIGISFSF